MENVFSGNTESMGASGNSNATRLAVLQERKKTLEETLIKKNQELKELCLQEADITGIIPTEMPLQPGETPPTIRRKVGTSYLLPENLLKSNSGKDEVSADLELQLQLHVNMADAALGLARDPNLSKTVRRQHKIEYQNHRREYNALQEKIVLLKEAQLRQNQLNDQYKQKKKPRPPDRENSLSPSLNVCLKTEPLNIRPARNTIQTDNISELYPQLYYRGPNKNLDNADNSPGRYDDLSSPFYKLSINGFKTYMDRRESYSTSPMYKTYQMNYHQHSPSYQTNYLPNHSPLAQSPNLQHSPLSQHSPRSQGSSQCQSGSPHFQNPDFNQMYSQRVYQNSHMQNYGKYSPILSSTMLKSQHMVRHYPQERYMEYNPLQIQPHQQYENNFMTSGLGGCWKWKENGEVIWCNSTNTIDSNWPKEKRFGSLDRRKNRRVQKQMLANPENKSATLATIPYNSNYERTNSNKSEINCNSAPEGQLVRTQSLGSVGAQTISDTVWPSDDNSSCDSENHYNKLSNKSRKIKQKEWKETSLDGPVSPNHSLLQRSHSAAPSIISAEEKYVPLPHIPLSYSSKAPLEIPAESNLSPKRPDNPNIELFNNNIPKNGMLVQAGHCKPYHEETKPFEMSDFYKYSTKFKKSPSKSIGDTNAEKDRSNSNVQKNLEEHYEQNNYREMQHSKTKQNSQNFSANDINNDMLYQKPLDPTQNSWYSGERLQKDNNDATLV